MLTRGVGVKMGIPLYKYEVGWGIPPPSFDGPPPFDKGAIKVGLSA